MDNVIVGKCSCGGNITVPNAYMSVIPPVPTCANCGKTQNSNWNTPYTDRYGNPFNPIPSPYHPWGDQITPSIDPYRIPYGDPPCPKVNKPWIPSVPVPPYIPNPIPFQPVVPKPSPSEKDVEELKKLVKELEKKIAKQNEPEPTDSTPEHEKIVGPKKRKIELSMQNGEI